MLCSPDQLAETSAPRFHTSRRRAEHEDRDMERERLERRTEQAIWEHPHLTAVRASRYAPVNSCLKVEQRCFFSTRELCLRRYTETAVLQISFVYKKPSCLKQTWSVSDRWLSAKAGKRTYSAASSLSPYAKACANPSSFVSVTLQGVLLQLLPYQRRVCWGSDLLQDPGSSGCCC